MPATATGGVLSRILGSGAPEAGAVVMGTGIVSVALFLDGWVTLSRILFVLAAGLWAILAVLVTARAARSPGHFRTEVQSVAALSWVAGTAVVGARVALLGWTGVAIALLGAAFVLWTMLLGPVLGSWKTPTVGVSLLLTVATESLAVLAATVGIHTRADWLELAALVPFGLGLSSYVFVMCRFDLRQLLTGRGDHWITGGALAISTLAAGNIAAGARALGILGHGRGALEDIVVALWVASVLWLPALLFAELLHPRPRYDVRRWSTVFPVGMYAACSYVAGAVAHVGAITRFAQVWVWVAVAVWAAVLGAMIASAIVRSRTA